MQKRVNWKYVLPVISLAVFLLLVVLLNFSNPLLAPQITTPPTTCTTPNMIPATINAPTTLCGTITMTAPTIITSGVIVNCLPGTIINYGGSPTAMFDAIQIAPGVVSAQINGCTFKGRFLSAIHLMSGVLSSQINSNTIFGAKNGIIEDYLASNNIYSNNNIQNTGVGMKLEGQQGNTNNNVISNNDIGIFTGIDSATLNPSSPNAVCSSGFAISWSAWGSPPVHPSIQPVCSILLSGNMQRINSNSITNNAQGIVVYGIDNQIKLNTINSNQIGVEVNAIYVGSEINPNIQPTQWFPLGNLQEYFNSGVRIIQNNINNNGIVGIRMNGGSTYFWQSSSQYHRGTIIGGNIISLNGQQNMQDSAGIVIGSKDAINQPNIFEAYFRRWNEYTKIISNSINNNNNDGVLLEMGYMYDVMGNQISNNLRNGISVGTAQSSPGIGFIEYSSPRYILGNQISNNLQYGIFDYNGALGNLYLNQINSNKKGIYIPESPKIQTQPVYSVDCNDLSYNLQEGFDYDAKNPLPLQPFSSSAPQIYTFKRNRVLGNGADGIRYYLDSTAHLNSISLSTFSRTVRNHIKENGFNPNPAYPVSGYGINSQGFYGMGFFGNNFVNNNLGSALDSGSNTVENIWDEKQFEKYFDQITGGNCGGSCAVGCGWYLQCIGGMCQPPPNSGVSCNPSTGTANFYSSAYTSTYFTWPLPYTPVGNYGLPRIVPSSAAPPLQPTSCASDGQCMTYSCESYPSPISNQQCGNGDFIGSSSQFTGYYLPNTVCPSMFYSPPFFGTFPGQESLAPESSEKIDEPPVLLFEEEMYKGFSEEMKKDPMFEQMLKDRRYIAEQERLGLGEPIDSLDSFLKYMGEQI